MKISQPKRSSVRRGALPDMISVDFEARDFPKRELIEPKLAKFDFEVNEEYVGTSADIFLTEALTISPQMILRALTLSNFEFERPVSLAADLEVAAWGARFGFSNLNDWIIFHRVVTMALTKLPELSQICYAAYLFHLIKQDRGTGYQLAGVMTNLSSKKRSPILSRSQFESFMRVRTEFGSQIDVKLVAGLITGFTLVEALELIEAKLTTQQMEDVLQIRQDFKYDASVSELIAMLGTTLHRRLQSLMA